MKNHQTQFDIKISMEQMFFNKIHFQDTPDGKINRFPATLLRTDLLFFSTSKRPVTEVTVTGGGEGGGGGEGP